MKKLTWIMGSLSFLLAGLLGIGCGEDGTNSDTVADMSLAVHQEVATIMVLTWTQKRAVDSAWVEYTFENDEWLASPKKPGDAGVHSEVVLGVPADTQVTVRIRNEEGASIWQSETISGTTGSLPSEMPIPTLLENNPALASVEKWIMGSVENSQSESAYWESPYWMFIMDRNARIVWYYHNPLDSRILFPRVSPEGTYILFDDARGALFEENIVLRGRTLDLEYKRDISIPDMGWCYDMTDDDGILFDYYSPAVTDDYNGVLKERAADGTVRDIWNCAEWLSDFGMDPIQCYSNTVNWNRERGSVIVSLAWDPGTILEIERQTGAVKSQWGNLAGSWEFNPPGIEFYLQHYPNITKDGTLLVLSIWPPNETQETRIMEFEIEDENKVLNQIWSYGGGVEDYALNGGEATRVGNGNTLISYGTGGVIKEVTPDKQIAWSVLFDAPFPTATNNKLVGHLTLLDDLYSLNQATGGDSDIDTDADADNDTDTDTDTIEIVPGDNPFEMNCDGGVLFDWGDQTITQYLGSNMEQADLDYIWDRTWEDEVMTATSYDKYSEGELAYEYYRVYDYDDNGLLTSTEWEYDYAGAHQHYWMNFTYDEEERLVEALAEYETDNSGIIELYYRYTYTYEEEGVIAQYLVEFGAPYEIKRGFHYEYDEKGRVVSAIHLDPDDDWSETEFVDEYFYDDLGRISEISYESDYEGVGWTYKYIYKGDTPQIISINDASDDSLIKTYEWEDHTLKISDYYWPSVVQYIFEVEFTEEGNSSFLGIFPTPTSLWIINYYGLGYINGCNGIGE